MVTKQEINRIVIECRHGSGYPVWNIMMLVTPKPNAPTTYEDLVLAAEKVLREAKNLKFGNGWYVRNAEVMGWSASKKTNLQHRGYTKPHEYRVTLDIVNSKDEREEVTDEVFEGGTPE